MSMVQASKLQNKQSRKMCYTQLLLKLTVKQEEKYPNSLDNSLKTTVYGNDKFQCLVCFAWLCIFVLIWETTHCPNITLIY